MKTEHDPQLCFPIPLQCGNYQTPQGSRCTNRATVRVYDQDGKPIPGGWECEDCATALIAELQEKLNWIWTTQPLHQYPDCVIAYYE